MAASKDNADEPVIIKKYANRRLYNTAKSAYVTLDNLAEMVRDGQDFVVRDAKSGADITRSVLTQIIFEEEAKGKNLLPANFLRQLIRMYGDTMHVFVPGYLDAAMENFARNQERMKDQVSQAFGSNPATAPFEALARHNMEWFEKSMRMFPPFAAGGERPAEDDTAAQATAKPDPEKEADLKGLKDQIAAMQAQINKLSDDA